MSVKRWLSRIGAQCVPLLEEMAKADPYYWIFAEDQRHTRQRVASDQKLFANGLATYQRLVASDYFGHKQVYDLLHDVLLQQAKDDFVFADLACGHAPYSAAALAGTFVGRYIGVDISKPALQIAKQALASLPCPIELRCQDFVEAIDDWQGPLDVVWIGLSLHHLRTTEKQAFMKKVGRLLPRDGLFMIWEPTCLEGENRDGSAERFSQFLKGLPLSDEDFAAMDRHQRASGYAETAAAWKRMAREAGFEQADELFTAPNQLSKIYRFRH